MRGTDNRLIHISIRGGESYNVFKPILLEQNKSLAPIAERWLTFNHKNQYSLVNALWLAEKCTGGVKLSVYRI